MTNCQRVITGNEQGNSRGSVEELDGSEDLDSSSQSDCKEDRDLMEAKILSEPMPSIHQDLHDHVLSKGYGDPAPNLEAFTDLQTSVDAPIVELEVATVVEGLGGAQKGFVCLEENEDVLGVGRDTREKEAKGAPTIEFGRGVQGVDRLEGEHGVAKLDGRQEVQELEEGGGFWGRPRSTLVQEMASANEVPILEGAQGVERLQGAKGVKEMEGSKRVDNGWALLEGRAGSREIGGWSRYEGIGGAGGLRERRKTHLNGKPSERKEGPRGNEG